MGSEEEREWRHVQTAPSQQLDGGGWLAGVVAEMVGKQTTRVAVTPGTSKLRKSSTAHPSGGNRGLHIQVEEIEPYASNKQQIDGRMVYPMSVAPRRSGSAVVSEIP